MSQIAFVQPKEVLVYNVNSGQLIKRIDIDMFKSENNIQVIKIIFYFIFRQTILADTEVDHAINNKQKLITD